MIQIIDSHNYFRRRLEKARAGQSIPRILFYETFLDLETTKVYCWDGFNNNARRRAIYPAYKSKRPPMSEPIAKGLAFFRELMCHSKATQIQVPTYEADDIMAMLARGYQKAGVPHEIVSNDYDLVATGSKVVFAPQRDVLPKDVHLYKTLVGDQSDSIGGIKGFGSGAWDELTATDRARLNENFENRDRERLRAFPWPKQRGVASWVHNNLDTLMACWDVTSFIEIPDEDLALGIKHGAGNPEAGEALMKEYFI